MDKRRLKYRDQTLSGDLIIILTSIVVYSWIKRHVHVKPYYFLVVPIIILVLFGLVYFLTRRLRRRLDIKSWPKMSGAKFEDQAVLWLKSNGFNKVIKTEYYDMGVDIIAHKNSIRYAVQVKRYTKPVGVAAVRAVVSGMVMYGCDQSMVITNSTYTARAKQLALANNCHLIDGSLLNKTTAHTRSSSSLS